MLRILAFRSKGQDKTNTETNLRSFLFLHLTDLFWFVVAIMLPFHTYSQQYIVHYLVDISIL